MVNDKCNIAWNKANGKNHKDEENCPDIPQQSRITCIQFACDVCVAVNNNHKWNQESEEGQGDEVIELEGRGRFACVVDVMAGGDAQLDILLTDEKWQHV